MADDARLAVLIDADNVSGKKAADILGELASFGTLTVKRAYGDWTSNAMNSWRDELHRHAIQPVQQFAYTVGKNATDSALIIDAMDLLYTGDLDGFCLVSSDSDFTRLATRLRESGRTVYGLGARKTPEAFVAACDRFIFLEVIGQGQQPQETDDGGTADPDAAPVPELRDLLLPAVSATAKDSGWSSLSAVGQHVHRNHASFDPRNYGFKQLNEAVRTVQDLEVREIADDNGFESLWVRPRQRPARKRAARKRSGSAPKDS